MELKEPTTLEVANDFDGVFRFTNPTDEEFIFMWNNKEYVFPAQTTCPMIIQNETLENIQSIRKKAAYKLAVREFYANSPVFKKLNKANTLYPAVYDDKVLEPMIEMCLSPLPVAKAQIREGKKTKVAIRASKALNPKESANVQFKDIEESSVGEMPDAEM